MYWRKLLPLFCTGVLLFSLLPLGALAAIPTQQNTQAKIEPLVLQELATRGQTDYFIWMTAKADLTPAFALPTKLEKGRFVYETLVTTAERTQKDLRAYLDRQGVKYEAFYIANKILVYGGSYNLLQQVAGRPDVAQVTANHKFQLQEPFRNPDQGQPDAVEPNITFVKAPLVWALGFTGQGIVLAGNDTGLDEAHPAIARHYRGCLNPPACTSWDHNYNWWDATGTYPNDPWDGFGHGTHTTGTMVGDDGGTNQIGMAPGAKTVHCKNMTDGGGGDDNTFTTCFQWDLAPWNLNHQYPRPDLAPDAINNSWGYWGGGAPQFEDEIAALQAAGIVVEVSAGNEGEPCSSLRSPGDYEQVLTTGSVQHAAPYPGTITDFSSRGPSSLYPNDYFPDIMAPGENIRSSVPGGGYEGGWSGTSMAGPHATALIALLWSANPGIRGHVALTYQIIKDTAAPLTGQGGSNCGGNYTDGPNNDWGYGTIDALAAVLAARDIGGAGWLNGTATDAHTSLPVEGVHVTAYPELGRPWDDMTDASGFYTMTVAPGVFTVTADIFGYSPGLATGVVVVTHEATVQDFSLEPLPTYVISGTVTEAGTGDPLAAVVEVLNTPIAPVPTNPATGYYSLTVPAGTYRLRATSAPLAPAYQDVVADHDQTVNFQLYGFCEVFSDTVENGNPGWTPGGSPNTWAITTESYHSPSHSWTDSPGGNYTDYNDNYISSPIFDLSDYAGVVLQFWHTYDTEATWDFCRVEYSNDGGATWNQVASYDGHGDWTQVQLPIPELDAQAQARIRFHFTSDTSVTFDGWHVDDIALIAGGPACVPLAPVAGFESNSPILDGDLAVFTNTTTGTPPITYLWDFGDGTTSTDTNPTHTYPAPGTYEVVLTATNAEGSGTVSHPFVVECAGVHDADFTWAPSSPFAGGTVVFTGTASGGEPITYTWDFGDGGSDSGANVSHVYAAVGTYTVTMTAANDCPSELTVQHQITVQEPPCPPVEADFTWAPTVPTVDEVVTFNGVATSTVPIVAYDWNLGDGTVLAGEMVTHTYAASGTYTVILTATNDCGEFAVASNDVTVEPLPPCDEVAIVTATYEIVACDVTFNVEVTGTAPFTYLWEFGDGMTSTLAQPTHTYTATGTYSVTVHAYNCADGQARRDLTVTVQCNPVYTIYLPLVYKAGP